MFKKLGVTTMAYITILSCSNLPHSESSNIVAGDTSLYTYTVDVQVSTFMGLGEKTEKGWCVLVRRGDSETKLLTERGSLDQKQMEQIVGTGYTHKLDPNAALARGEDEETILALASAPNNRGVCCMSGGGQDGGITRVENAIVAIRMQALLSKEKELALTPLRVSNMINEMRTTQPNKGHERQCVLP